MELNDWLQLAIAKLKHANIATARLDCLILLEDATGQDRGWLLAHPEYALQGLALKELNMRVERRLKHEPLAYIRGKSEFYGRDFMVSPDTLQPRPESETMIDLALEVVRGARLEVRDKTWCVLDIGTGCGALGITAKLEHPDAEVIATDISTKCLKIAKQNAKKLDAKMSFYQGDLLQPLPPSTFYLLPSIILTNLPYVPDSHTINQAAMFEPRQAIFGGPDGLDLYRRLFDQAKLLPTPPQYVLTESLPFQHEALQSIAEATGYGLEVRDDFIQAFKKVNS